MESAEEDRLEALKELRVNKIVDLLKQVKSEAQFKKEFDIEKNLEAKDGPSKKTKVYKLQSKLDKKIYAIKVYYGFKDITKEEVGEILMLKEYTHSNILKIQDYYTWESQEIVKDTHVLATKMEWYEHSLADLINKDPKQFNEIDCFIQLMTGLNLIRYLKDEYNLNLFNIKPSNILLDENGIWKFTDFGGAATNLSKFSVNYAQIKDLANPYLAPEYLAAIKASQNEVKCNYEKCDVYSLGMIILQTYNGYSMKEFEDKKINEYKGTITEVNQNVNQSFVKDKAKNKFFKQALKDMTQGEFDQRKKANEIDFGKCKITKDKK